ncbi:MAG: bifunctional hydroxymethylpyrimidine kinase/phosphomethylpyrimidine kinase [Candidatus Verstraetearchaeota archaeon]|nr:bifunctional hydroxymethylpyrimidine kinase/phosphomethylpyrimidine kinase [Candidatus Verstraetearchaeota archaeon]
MTECASIPVVLTIAGSDSGGGAGIEADLKTFASLGVHGAVALTAVTAQNTVAVMGIHEIPPEMVRRQIDAVVDDLGVRFAKTGMLSSSPIVRCVSEAVEAHGLKVVVDPVMVAKSGAPLLQEEAVKALKELLIPRAEVVTPNLEEASTLSGIRISSQEDMIRAAGVILDMGSRSVVVKGGHLPGDPVDVLLIKGDKPRFYPGERIQSGCTHGTGCTFSAALASYLALGSSLESSVKHAKVFVSHSIQFGLKIGKGVGSVNPVSALEIDAERFRVLTSVTEGVCILESSEVAHLLAPECQINLVMALPNRYVVGEESVCGIPGRISNAGGRLKASSSPAFGASRHVARAVLSAMEFDPTVRSAMNVRYSEEVISAAKSLGYTASSYDREKEPLDVKFKEGASIPWGVSEAIKATGNVPDVIFHKGDWGKEPMVLILGRDAVEVATKAVMIARKLAKFLDNSLA